MRPVLGLLAGALLAAWCGPQPAPKPSPSPTATPTAAPTPASCLPPDGPQWRGVEGVTPAMTPAVREAQTAIGDVCGHEPEASLDDLAEVLNGLDGLCAGRMADAVMAQRPDGLWEEHHAVSYANGCWIATPFRGVWNYQP